MHYGESNQGYEPKTTKEIIKRVNGDDKFVIFLCDFLNINQEVIDIYNSIKCEKLLVINKCELIPDEVYKQKLAAYVRNEYHVDGDIKIKGGTKNHGVGSVYRYLMERDIHETYVLGLSNSGKSTFINDLITANHSKVNKINVNSKANTTLDFIKVKIDNYLTIIDSPGFVLENSADTDAYDQYIKALTFNMKAGETLSVINGKYYFNFSEDTPINLFINGKGKHKKYFKEIELNNDIKLKEDDMDIIILGVGFIRVKNKCIVKTNVDKKHIEIRKSMFGNRLEEDDE
jgi:ribosome biogenesis GTPase A